MPHRRFRFLASRICLAALIFVMLRSAGLHAQENAAVTQPPTDARGEGRAAAAVSAMVGAGFSGVAAVEDSGRLVVRYENTRYRDDRRALNEAVSTLRDLAGGGELVLVPTRWGIPLQVALVPDTSAGSAGVRAGTPRVSLDLSAVPRALLAGRGASPPFRRLDVIVHPYFEAAFGNYRNPIASRTGIAPEVRTVLRPGLVMSAEALFTLQDDVPTGDSPVRPLVVTLSQTVRLARNTFVQAAAGLFSSDRYGMDVQARTYSNDGLWMAGAEAAMTGSSTFAREWWGFAPAKEGTALVEVARRIPRYDLTVRATAGAFLGDERGVRVDVVRRFGELEIGGFGVASGSDANGGMMVRIPLPQTRYGRPGLLRVRAAEAFRWQYRYHGFVPGGREFNTGYAMDELDHALDLQAPPAPAQARP